MGYMFDIIFLMLLVAFIVTRLYSVFGSHAGEKNLRIVIKPLDKDLEKSIIETLDDKEMSEEKSFIADADIENLAEPDKTLTKIPDFNKDSFLKSAGRVFEMVVQAFSSGNMENVRSLLSKKVNDAFVEAIKYREENSLSSEVDFICFDKSEIKSAKLLKNSVRIVVEFVSEQVNILRDARGEVIEGDDNFVQKITDVWTFERTLNAKNKSWVLVSTKKSV